MKTAEELCEVQIFEGNIPYTENYSIFGAEVLTGPNGDVFAQKNTALIQNLMAHDYVVIGGEAKSHCVAWTIADLLTDILNIDEELVKKVYLLEDCTSPVVIPPVGLDFTDQANKAFDDFKNAGMHVVKSTDPVESWPGIEL